MGELDAAADDRGQNIYITSPERDISKTIRLIFKRVQINWEPIIIKIIYP